MCARATLLEGASSRGVAESSPIEEPIKLGVVGLGSRAVHNVVGRVIDYDDYRLVAICDRRGNLVERVKADLARERDVTVRGYTDYSEMLGAEGLDAVAVQIDADKQASLICEGLQAGCHVMAEVPLAYSIDDCRRIARAVEETGKTFLLMEQTRFWGFIRAWREIVQTGVIGRPLFVEGEYIGYYPGIFLQDDAGCFYTPEQVREAPEAKPTWRALNHPITYLPHELSPLLYVLEDRVERVVAMSTRPQGYRHPEIPIADIQVALMHTARDAVMKLAVGFTTPVVHRGETTHHWYHIKGTEGVLEWSRTDSDAPKLWVHGWQMPEPIAMPWGMERVDAPALARGSGHGGADFYVFAQFADAILRGVPPELDIYKAIDTAAPAILAAKSIDEGNTPQDVPDFRPAGNQELA